MSNKQAMQKKSQKGFHCDFIAQIKSQQLCKEFLIYFVIDDRQ